MRSDLRYTLMLAGAALLVHAAALIAVHLQTGSIQGYAFRSLDCDEFYAIAENLVEHGAFSQNAEPPFKPDTWRTPGYPLFLATAMLLFGKSPATLVLVQQVLSALNVLLVFRLARGWMSDRRAALAAVLFLLEPYHLFYSLWLLSTTWLMTVVLLTWWAWLRAIGSGKVWRFALLGGLCGFLVLTWPGAILVPVAAFGGIILAAVRRTPRRIAGTGMAVFGAGILFISGCAAAIAPWMVRNEPLAGHFALTYQGGVVLAYFKATEVALWREGLTADRYLETSLSPDRREEPHPIWESIDKELQLRFYDLPIEQQKELTWPNLAQGNRTTVDSFRISGELESIGLAQLSASPWSTLACYLARCGSILTFPLDLALWPPNGVEVNRLRSAAVGALYLLLCAAAVVRLGRGRMGFEAGFFPLACTLALLLATTPQTDPRFRVLMIPLLIVVALLPVGRAIPADPDGDRPASATGGPDRRKEPC
ncbi:MAG: glycosyltransferase family 39 protein [Planctomycetota bacterium]